MTTLFFNPILQSYYPPSLTDRYHRPNEKLRVMFIRCNKDYGWSQFEGSRCQEAVEDRYGDCASADRSDFVFPEFEYCHPGYYSTLDTEDEFTNGVDICGSRAVVGNAVIGKPLRFVELVPSAEISRKQKE